MYTADDARENDASDLDMRIKESVKEYRQGRGAYLRVYIDDWFCHSIETELKNRGFKNIQVPYITLKGDVYFEW